MKRKRKSKAIDPDVKALRAACRALMATSPRMQEATCRYLWDKFVTHGPVQAAHDQEDAKGGLESL